MVRATFDAEGLTASPGDVRTDSVSLAVTTRSGEFHQLNSAIGLSLMEVIRDSGVDELLALCGGVLSCATCHVLVDPEHLGKLDPISDDEDDLLSGLAAREPGSRLSCQIRLQSGLNGLAVTLPAEEW